MKNNNLTIQVFNNYILPLIDRQTAQFLFCHFFNNVAVEFSHYISGLSQFFIRSYLLKESAQTDLTLTRGSCKADPVRQLKVIDHVKAYTMVLTIFTVVVQDKKK